MRGLEAVKSTALIGLVGLSLALSGVVWLQPKGTPAPPEGGEVYNVKSKEGREQELLDLLSPSRIVIHLGRNRHTVYYPGSSAYEKAWRLALDVARGASFPPAADVRGVAVDAVEQARTGRGVELLLPARLPLEVLLDSWGIGGTPPAPQLWVGRMLIPLEGGGSLFLGGTTRDGYVALDAPAKPPGLDALVSEVAGAQLPESSEFSELSAKRYGLNVDDGIFVPNAPPRMGRVRARPETPDPEQLAALFFPDMSVVRRVREKDRAAIYTDGARGLRIFTSGAIDYSEASEGESVAPDNPLKALTDALDFVTFKGKWPGESFISSLKSPSAGETSTGPYLVGFSYRYHGYPVMGRSDAIEVEITGGRSSAYRRFVLQPSEGEGTFNRVIDVPRVMQTVKAAGPEVLGGDAPVIADVTLGYYQGAPDEGPEYLRPVWVVELADGRRLFIDAFTGEGWAWTGRGRKHF